MATGIKIDANGLKSIVVIENLDRAFKRGMERASFYIRRDLVSFVSKKILEKPKTGNVYLLRLNGLPKRHTASNADISPPEFPANFTGSLRRSIVAEPRGSFQIEFGAGARKTNTGDAHKYARILERGGMAGRGKKAKIKPRKYLEQTIDANNRNITKHIENEVAKAARVKR